jgi:hypothetical protein
MTLQTEFEFALPRGYVDSEGNLHKDGVMRLATAADEIYPLKDMRVKSNQAYLVIVLFSRVITRLGSLTDITPTVIERLFSADLAYLQDFYRHINENGSSYYLATCPECSHSFEMDIGHPGGS